MKQDAWGNLRNVCPLLCNSDLKLRVHVTNDNIAQVTGGNMACLYQGAFAASAATAVGYFPWLLTFNFLNQRLSVPPNLAQKLMRNAGIGLGASIASDVCSNSIRVIKTTKQATAAYQTELSYRQAAAMILEDDGWMVSCIRSCPIDLCPIEIDLRGESARVCSVFLIRK